MVHIGKKIKEILLRSGIKQTIVAKNISMTPAGLNKVFEKKSVQTELLDKIGIALNHDFFQYYKSYSKETSDLMYWKDTADFYKSQVVHHTEEAVRWRKLYEKTLKDLNECKKLIKKKQNI